MLVVPALFFHFLSILLYHATSYNRSLYFAKKAAVKYIKAKNVFSSKRLERHIERCADKITSGNISKIQGKPAGHGIGMLASTIYDVGGHTECLMRLSESLYEEYDLHLFLTNFSGDSRIAAKTKYAYLETILTISEADSEGSDFGKKINQLINAILASEVKILFVYMHMYDVISCAVLSFLVKNSGIKVFFFNHADHTFSLGFEFSHLIIELRKQGQFVTEHYRNKKTTLIPLQGVMSKKLRTYSIEELQTKREELGLSSEDLVSLSGFASYKIFKNKESAYLEFIKTLLIREPRLKHILVTEISAKERKILDRTFRGNEHLLKRLIIIDRVADFDLLLQVGDVFIDSFPFGSALVHIDAIRNRRPTIIKKNHDNELYSFYDYLYDGYEYAIDNIDEMLEKTLLLLGDKEKQLSVAERCYAHYLSTYEFEMIKSQYKHLIEEYQPLDWNK